ncbi:MAG: hypothetical protein JNJ57_17330 [Saprospiraceae bacterium]|nr:hypothetical protein [Saprospiraceae bacterium]
MLKMLFLPVFCSAGLLVSGQQADQDRRPLTVKCAALSLLNVSQTSFDMRADIPIARRWAVEPGAGFIFESAPFAQYLGESYKGFKIRPAIKFYFKKKEAHKDIYLSLAFKYHRIWHNEYVFAFRHGEQYTQWMMNKRNLSAWGGTLNIGGQVYKGKKKRLLIESYVGFGWRRVFVSKGNLPPDAEETEPGFGFGPENFSSIYWQNNPPGYEYRPDVQIGFCIGWARTKAARKIELGD